jgi:hypothetical protein
MAEAGRISLSFPPGLVSRKAEEAYNLLICRHETGVTGLC